MLTTLLTHTRRNHALEHATINLLTQRYPHAQTVGLSDPFGFTLHTTLDADKVTPVIVQALTRLQSGEHNLRIHPNCGTNLVVTAAMTTMATLLGMGTTTERRKRLERVPQAILLNVFVLIFSRPVADWVQANISTATDLSQVRIGTITTQAQPNACQIRVRITHGEE